VIQSQKRKLIKGRPEVFAEKAGYGLQDNCCQNPEKEERNVKQILIALLILIVAACTKATTNTPPMPIEQAFTVQQQKIVFTRHEYQINTAEQERKQKNEDRF
jgi:hypothetical protein